MAKTIHFELTTPERVVVRREISEATIPTQEGEITVLADHIPLVANLVAGVLTVRNGKQEEYLAVSGGFLEVQPGNRIVVLADTAERAEELDLKKIEEARELAKKILSEKKSVDLVSSAAAMAALEREMARAKVVRRLRERHGSHPPGPASGDPTP